MEDNSDKFEELEILDSAKIKLIKLIDSETNISVDISVN